MLLTPMNLASLVRLKKTHTISIHSNTTLTGSCAKHCHAGNTQHKECNTTLPFRIPSFAMPLQDGSCKDSKHPYPLPF